MNSCIDKRFLFVEWQTSGKIEETHRNTRSVKRPIQERDECRKKEGLLLK